MFNTSIFINVDFVDARHTGLTNGAALTGSFYGSENEASINLKTLADPLGKYYTDNYKYMTLNDILFAVRTHADAAGFVPSGTTRI